VVECQTCGLLYLSPRPEGQELAAYYPDEYYDELASGIERARPASESLRRLGHRIRRTLLNRFYGYPVSVLSGEPEDARLGGWWIAVAAQFDKWRLRASGREAAIIPFIGEGLLLDVGCGTGKDLLRLQEAGWKVTGVEISAYAASLARQRLGCEVVPGHFDEAPLDGRRFDVVRLSHALEHFPSPRRSLEKVHRLLRPGGLLWIEVPNAAGLERRLFGPHWYQWDLPRHLYHFTPRTLARLLRETGFRPRKMTCDGRKGFFAESLADVLVERFGVRRSSGKKIAVLGKPLVYAMGLLNRGGIMTVHAVRG
jgi:SAM-dependent methyltransferase